MFSSVLGYAQPGYAWIGQHEEESSGKTLAASTGSFTLAGQDASLTTTRKLSAGNASFTLTGQAVGVKANRRIACECGEFSVTGNDADLVYLPTGARRLSAGSGSFSLIGQSVNLQATRKLPAGYGSYVHTGHVAGVLVGRKIAADPGIYILSVFDVHLFHGVLAIHSLALPAYWVGGFFGADKPQLMKMMRSTQLLSDQIGFHVKCRCVDYDRFTLRNPQIVDFGSVNTSQLAINRKTRLLSLEILFPEPDTDSSVMELSNSYIAVSDR